jgi:hypothetical protein
MAKFINKLLEFLFDKAWGMLIMLLTSSSFLFYLKKISNYLADPLILYLAFLFVIGLMLWIINQIRNYRFNKRDKSFHETFLKLRINKQENDSSLITIDNKKNIDFYQLSNIFYDIKNEPIFVIGINFIDPIYKTPKPTIVVKGEGNKHATHKFISFYEDNDYLYSITLIIKNFEINNSVYSIEVKRNES